MTPSQLGFVQGLILSVVAVELDYVANNIIGSGIVSVGIAGVISGLALSLGHLITQYTRKGLLGSTRIKV